MPRMPRTRGSREGEARIKRIKKEKGKKKQENENSSSGTTRSGKGQRGCSSSKKKEKRGRKFIQTETKHCNCHQASGMGGKSPDQPLVLDIWRKIPSEPLTGRPRSVKFY